jgi:hypothetical protein
MNDPRFKFTGEFQITLDNGFTICFKHGNRTITEDTACYISVETWDKEGNYLYFGNLRYYHLISPMRVAEWIQIVAKVNDIQDLQRYWDQAEQDIFDNY